VPVLWAFWSQVPQPPPYGSCSWASGRGRPSAWRSPSSRCALLTPGTPPRCRAWPSRSGTCSLLGAFPFRRPARRDGFVEGAVGVAAGDHGVPADSGNGSRPRCPRRCARPRRPSRRGVTNGRSRAPCSKERGLGGAAAIHSAATPSLGRRKQSLASNARLSYSEGMTYERLAEAAPTTPTTCRPFATAATR
jgi:hypothetical protein